MIACNWFNVFSSGFGHVFASLLVAEVLFSPSNDKERLMRGCALAQVVDDDDSVLHSDSAQKHLT